MIYKSKKIKAFMMLLFLFSFFSLLAEENTLSREIGEFVREFAVKLKDNNIKRIYIINFLEEQTEKSHPDMNNELKKLFRNKLTDYNFIIVEGITKTDGILVGRYLKEKEKLRVSIRVEDINGEIMVQTDLLCPLTDEIRRLAGGAGIGEEIGFISISTNQDPCDVFIQNVKIGQTGTGKLSYPVGGPYTIEISKPGYESRVFQNIYISEKEPLIRTDIQLKPKEQKGKITVKSDPPGAEILLNEAKTGKKTPYTFKNMSLGEYNISVRKEGFKETKKSCMLEYKGDHKVVLLIMEAIKVKEVGAKFDKANYVSDKSPEDVYNKAFLLSCCLPGLGSRYLENKGDERFSGWFKTTALVVGLTALGIIYNQPVPFTYTNKSAGEKTESKLSPWFVKAPCFMAAGYFWYRDLSKIREARNTPRQLLGHSKREGLYLSLVPGEIRINLYKKL